MEEKAKICAKKNLPRKFFPNYNKSACEYFDNLNKKMEWNGQHATYLGEKLILSYFVDYYEPTQNIVIEWDEEYHRKKVQKKSDVIRENRIKETLKCRFFRYDVLTNNLIEV